MISMTKIQGIPVLLLFSAVLTVCICAQIPPRKLDGPASKLREALTEESDSAAATVVKVRKRDLQEQQEQEEDENENAVRVVLPMVISKRSATALGKLMHLLRTSMDNSGGRLFPSSREQASNPTHSANYEMHLQRRNQLQKSNYLRCYFNAVSCF